MIEEGGEGRGVQWRGVFIWRRCERHLSGDRNGKKVNLQIIGFIFYFFGEL